MSPVGAGVFVVLAGADDGQEAWASIARVTQRSQGVAADLVLIQAGEALASLEGLLGDLGVCFSRQTWLPLR
jgi:hypothetical protein